MGLKKPKLVLDLKSSRTTPFARTSHNVNLARRRKDLPFSAIIRTALLIAVGVYALFGFAAAPSSSSSRAAEQTREERAQLENELAQVEQQIADYEATVSAYQKQGVTLKGEIENLNKKIDQLNLRIKVINLSLTRLNGEIDQNQKQIIVTQSRLDMNKSAIGQALQGIYENDRTSLVSALLEHENLSDFFSDFNNLVAVQDGLTTTVQEINELKDQLLDQKESLAAKKADAVAMKEFQDRQRGEISQTKATKDQLLKDTKGSEKAYQEKLQQTRATAAKIRNRLFELLGGGEMTFDQAYALAKQAQQATNVPASLLLAVLDRESALGKNVGKCSYKTAMAPGKPKSSRDDVTPFLQITSELGLDPEKTMVSCAISSDGAWGGAMGPAQFIPTTWMLYRDKIAQITGSNPPSPWRNSDAFVGTALYLQNSLKACSDYSGDTQIRCAAARYYAGGNWRRHLYTYGSGTLTRMKKFADDIEVLSGQE